MPGRVTTRREFDLLAAPDKVGRSGPLRVSFVSRGDDVRVAYAIGKSVGNAVTRNRIRRRLRAFLDLSPTLPSGLFLVRVGKGAEVLTYDELTTHLQQALRAL